MFSFSTKPPQLKQLRRTLKIITRSHMHTLRSHPSLICFLLYSISVHPRACNHESQYKSRSHNYNQPTVQSHTATARSCMCTFAHMPYHHILPCRHGLRNICFLTPCRNLLTLSIITAAYKTFFYRVVRVVRVCMFVFECKVSGKLV